jgi:seryl-tRNA synthetase
MTDRDFQEMSLRVAKTEDSVKHAHKRIDELQNITKAFYELAADVKVMVNEMANMKSDISDIRKKVDARDEEPNKLVFNIKNTVITGIVAALVGALIALIIK